MNKPLTNNDLILFAPSDKLMLAKIKKIAGYPCRLTRLRAGRYLKTGVIKHNYAVDNFSRTWTIPDVLSRLIIIYSNNNWFEVRKTCGKDQLIKDKIIRILIEGYIVHNREHFYVEFGYKLNKINLPIMKLYHDYRKFCIKKIKSHNPKCHTELISLNTWCFFHKINVKIV
uniref:hypothetical protein n=1 Tax=Inonotus hispidus TaxID=40469 RepID=UPI0021820167|nr:hypothetical protein N4M07_mgp002 [Inonotus hispidus]UVF37940.1 hypothetical protein [Inonotus hispidus]